MTLRLVNRLSAIGLLLLLGVFYGCAGREYAPNRGVMYYHKELPVADRAVEAARAAGKNRECPAEFAAAEKLRNDAYDIYLSCRTEEGIAKANQATALANGLCPRKVEAPKPVPLAPPPPMPAAAPMVAPVPATKAEVKFIVLEDAHFDFDKSILTKEGEEILLRNIQVMKENPGTNVRVAGYSSASGTEEYNQKLSERRAKTVEDYLIREGGIAPERLTKIGYGETRPATYEPIPADINSKAAKSNMRVLFEVIVK
ncbi:MAG: OmpA family protein [Deltaproteobacteria bacterium]|nr:OmpA family protein [Deltaproteobacteria bacterium]